MANVIIDNSNLTDIANAIRTKKGVETQYKPSEMAAAVASIETFKPEETFNVTPTTSAQTITPTAGHVFSGGTVQAMPNGTMGTISATKSISGNTATVTPSVSAGTAGYNTHAAASGTAVTVQASELASGNVDIPTYTTIDVTNYASATVTIPQYDETITSIYSITSTCTHCTASGSNPTSIETGSTATLTFTAESGYVLPDTVTIVGATGTWNQLTGTLILSNATGHVSINIEAIDLMSVPLCLTALEAGSSVLLYISWTPWTGSYSLNGVDWITYPEWTRITLANVGDKVYFKGDLTGDCDTSNAYHLRFSTSGKLAAYGNINSMYVSSGFEDLTTLTYKCCYYGLFKNTAIATTPLLPATTLSSECYSYIFNGCLYLETPPELPATTLATGCYRGMFEGCTGINTAPTLAVTTLAERCYQAMFKGCTALTTSPTLPATTLATWCYYSMFEGCTHLTTPPALPATTLVANCYAYMFYGCTALYVEQARTSTVFIDWRLPTTGTMTVKLTQLNMFAGCAGTRNDDSVTIKAGSALWVYTQNTPV